MVVDTASLMPDTIGVTGVEGSDSALADDLSSVAPMSAHGGSGGGGAGKDSDHQYYHHNPNSSSNSNHHYHGDNHSLLGVIVDRSSFDEDDELTTFGGGGKGDMVSVFAIDEEEASVMTEMPTSVDAGKGGSGSGLGSAGPGIVMRNGKVRRKLRWKPRFGRKRATDGNNSNNNVSSNASVVSALTNKTTSTNRSTSTSRSIFSHFSKRSFNSFHTFHSTETPVVTNKANRPQAPHTVMRPNYQDSFDAKGTTMTMPSKHSTIDNEGQQQRAARVATAASEAASAAASASSTAGSANDDEKKRKPMNEVGNLERSSTLPDRWQENSVALMSPITEASPRSVSQRVTPKNRATGGGSTGFGVTASNTTKKNGESNAASAEKPKLSSPPRPRRPPLFKRRLRNSMKKNNFHGAPSSYPSTSDNINGSNRPTSPAESSQNSGSTTTKDRQRDLLAQTAPTASLSASISIERENSILPTLSADDYEEDRRVALHVVSPNAAPVASGRPPSRLPNTRSTVEEEKKQDEGEEVIADASLNTSGVDDLLMEENSIAQHTVGDQSTNSGVASAKSGVSSSPGTMSRRQRTGSSITSSKQPATSTSKASTTTTSAGGRTSPKLGIGRNRKYNRPVDSMTNNIAGTERRSMPVDLDEGAFLEAEHNLRAIHEMAQEHLVHGEYEEAVEVFEEILRGQQERYGQDHYRVGTALHNLGIVYLKKGDYAKAIETCSRAVQVRKESLVPNHPDVAVSLAQLGVAHLESRQFHKALDAFRDALHIRRNFLGPRHPKCSKILNNIGCALYSVEDYEESKRAFEEALDIQRDTLRNLPSAEGAESNGMQSNALLLSMASTLCNIGSIKLRWGDYDHAIIALDEALLIQQSVLDDNHPTVQSTLDSIAFVETARQGPLQAATNNLLQGASAVCNAGSSTNVAELLGLEGMNNLSPQGWFQNACGPLFADDEENVKILRIKKSEKRAHRDATVAAIKSKSRPPVKSSGSAPSVSSTAPSSESSESPFATNNGPFKR